MTKNDFLLNGNFFFPAVFSGLVSAWKNKVYVFFASLILLLFLSIPARAAVEEFIVKADDGVYSKFSYEELLDSYALKLMGKEGALYEEFAAKEVVALKISGHGYFDYKDILDYYAGSLSNGDKFDLLQYAGNGNARQAELPGNIETVSPSGGEIPAGDAGPEGDIKEEKDEELGLDERSGNEKEKNDNDKEEEREEESSRDEESDDEGSNEEKENKEEEIEEEEKEGEDKEEENKNEDDSEPGSSGEETQILGQAEVSLDEAVSWAQSNNAHQRYVDAAPYYWEFGEKTGIRPEVLYAQAAYETGFGRFGGIVPAEYNNWAGIKKGGVNGDEPEDHEEFASPEDGVRAHFNHMGAYVGISPVGETHDRYDSATRMSWAGKVETVEDLSGKWAPSDSYHERIVEMIDEMK